MIRKTKSGEIAENGGKMVFIKVKYAVYIEKIVLFAKIIAKMYFLRIILR